MTPSRRGFLLGLGSLLAVKAPPIDGGVTYVARGLNVLSEPSVRGRYTWHVHGAGRLSGNVARVPPEYYTFDDFVWKRGWPMVEHRDREGNVVT